MGTGTFFRESSLLNVLDALPCSVLVFNAERQVYFLNNYLEKCLHISGGQIVGRRGGEALGCATLLNGRDTLCGEGRQCSNCVLNRAINRALANNSTYRCEGLFKAIVDGRVHSMVLLVSSSPLCLDGKMYALVTIENIADIDRMNAGRAGSFSDERIIGEHASVKEMRALLLEAAQVDLPVLIQGESGTGKELAALEIHHNSSRRKKPFIAINCGSIPENLLESELFGHVKGAFTGALRERKGRFEMADGGTLFLDEIGDMPLAMQTKLLRFLQEGTFERVGGNTTFHVNVRLLAATHRNLQEAVQQGSFRLDLFYRLCVVPIRLPALRERAGDIGLLARHFVSKYDKWVGAGPRSFSPAALRLLESYAWPGNIRELQNIVQFALMKCRTEMVEVADLPPYLQEQAPGFRGEGNGENDALVSSRKKFTPEQVLDAIRRTGGNKLAAARELGISRATLYRFLEKMMS